MSMQQSRLPFTTARAILGPGRDKILDKLILIGFFAIKYLRYYMACSKSVFLFPCRLFPCPLLASPDRGRGINGKGMGIKMSVGARI
jgi:hypothetical protein